MDYKIIKKGIYVCAAEPTAAWTEAYIRFVSFGFEGTKIYSYVSYNGLIRYDGSNGGSVDVYCHDAAGLGFTGWKAEAYRTIEVLEDTSVPVSENSIYDFYTWFAANYTLQAPEVTVIYNDTMITIDAGEDVILHTSGQLLTGDIKITAK